MEKKGNTIALSVAVSLAYQPFLIAIIPIGLSAAIRTLNRLSSKNKELTSFFGGSFSYSLPIGMFNWIFSFAVSQLVF